MRSVTRSSLVLKSFSSRIALLKKKEKLVGNSALSAVNAASLNENLKALDHKFTRITDTAAFRDDNKVDGFDAMSTEADAFKLNGDPMKNEHALDDKKDDQSGDVGATGDDDTTGTESDTDKDTSTAENDMQTPGDPNQDAKKVNAHLPDLPNVSDKKGVKLELSSSESTDTVFYRLELKTFINGILANPPKYLSVQKIETLKKIKTYWINTLAPQCIYDVLSTVIRLPSMFKIHKKSKR